MFNLHYNYCPRSYKIFSWRFVQNTDEAQNWRWFSSFLAKLTQFARLTKWVIMILGNLYKLFMVMNWSGRYVVHWFCISFYAYEFVQKITTLNTDFESVFYGHEFLWKLCCISLYSHEHVRKICRTLIFYQWKMLQTPIKMLYWGFAAYRDSNPYRGKMTVVICHRQLSLMHVYKNKRDWDNPVYLVSFLKELSFTLLVVSHRRLFINVVFAL